MQSTVNNGPVTRSVLHSLRNEFLGGKVADSPGELDLIGVNLPFVLDAQFIALKINFLHKGDFGAVYLAFYEVDFAFLLHSFEGRFARQLVAIDLQIEGIFLYANLSVEFRLPLASYIGRARQHGKGTDRYSQQHRSTKYTHRSTSVNRSKIVVFARLQTV